MFVFDDFETVSDGLVGPRLRLSVPKNTIDIQQAMLAVANETDLMIRAFLDELRICCEHELKNL